MKVRLNSGLIKGSFILLVAFNIFNALNFFFHFAMARLLSVGEYGIFLTLFMIIYILGVFTESIQLVITKYTSKEEDNGKLKNIFKKTIKKSSFVAFFILLAYLVFAIPLSVYLFKIDYFLMALTGLMLADAFLIPVTRGVLQGRKRFFSLGANMVVESSVKLILAIIFVYLGLKVYGAILGTIIGVFIAFGFSIFSIRDILKSDEKSAETTGIYGYTRPTFFVILVILLFFTIDVFIVKVFFNEEIAGVYAIASILAKTIFFGTQPISKAMFPLSAESNLNKKKSENVFYNALGILLVAVTIALFLFYFFSDIIIRVFSGRYIPEAASILFYLGIAIGFLSLANLVLLYKLSLGKTKGYVYLIIFAVLDIVLLILFSIFFMTTLFQFAIAFISAMAAFFWASVLFLN